MLELEEEVNDIGCCFVVAILFMGFMVISIVGLVMNLLG